VIPKIDAYMCFRLIIIHKITKMIIVRATNINVFQVTLSYTISDCYFLNDVFDRVTSSYVRKFIFLEYVDL